jgi:hypothetical protein
MVMDGAQAIASVVARIRSYCQSQSYDYSLPAHPDVGGSSRPRPAADYDRAAVEVLGRVLADERDFGDWLGGRLRELADLLGGGSRLIARRPNSWAANHITELAEPDATVDDRSEVWRTWPAVEPAKLPEVDTSGWLLVPCVAACEYVEALETGTDAATPVADAIADRAAQAPRWRACGVAELTPQLVALRHTEQFDTALRALRPHISEPDDLLDTLLLASAPGDADVDALLRIAIDAEHDKRAVIDIDAAVTAAYRRILDRLSLPFENYWLEAMFE